MTSLQTILSKGLDAELGRTLRERTGTLLRQLRFLADTQQGADSCGRSTLRSIMQAPSPSARPVPSLNVKVTSGN